MTQEGCSEAYGPELRTKTPWISCQLCHSARFLFWSLGWNCPSPCLELCSYKTSSPPQPHTSSRENFEEELAVDTWGLTRKAPHQHHQKSSSGMLQAVPTPCLRHSPRGTSTRPALGQLCCVSQVENSRPTTSSGVYSRASLLVVWKVFGLPLPPATALDQCRGLIPTAWQLKHPE